MTNNCAIIYFIAYRTNRRLWDQKLKGLLWNASNAGRRVGGRWILSFVISQTFCSCLCLFLSHGEFTTESSKYLSGLVYGRPRPLWFLDGITSSEMSSLLFQPSKCETETHTNFKISFSSVTFRLHSRISQISIFTGLSFSLVLRSPKVPQPIAMKGFWANSSKTRV